jgi:hypothetical protein
MVLYTSFAIIICGREYIGVAVLSKVWREYVFPLSYTGKAKSFLKLRMLSYKNEKNTFHKYLKKFTCHHFLFYGFRLKIRRINKKWKAEAINRRKARLTKHNAKCRHLKKLTCKVTLRHVFNCLRPRAPYPPPPKHCIRVYRILIYTGGGGDWTTRDKVRGATVNKAGS